VTRWGGRCNWRLLFLLLAYGYGFWLLFALAMSGRR
jgi:hypothetical protein